MVRDRSAEMRSAWSSASHGALAAPHRVPAARRVLALQRSIGNQLVLHGTVHLAGFDAVRGEMTVRLRYKDPGRVWQAARATTPDELWKRLEPILHEAFPGIDPPKLADDLRGLLGQLASGKLSVEPFVKAVEQSARRAAQGANVDPTEQALWRFLAEVGPELEATGVLVAGDETIAKRNPRAAGRRHLDLGARCRLIRGDADAPRPQAVHVRHPPEA